VPPGGGRAGRSQHLGTGARGALQVRGVEAGHGGLDARREIPRVVVEHLGQAMPRVQRTVRRRPQCPYLVACLVQPVMGFPQRAPAQVLVCVDQRAPAEERPLPDLIAGHQVRSGRLAAGLGPAGRCAGVLGLGAGRGDLIEHDEVRSSAAPAALLDAGLGRDGQIELGAVRELGEDPPDPLISGPDPVPQHVDDRAQIRQRRDDHRFRGPDPLSAGQTGLGVDTEPGINVGKRVGRTAPQRAADQQ
jgi:hypothetical protein